MLGSAWGRFCCTTSTCNAGLRAFIQYTTDLVTGRNPAEHVLSREQSDRLEIRLLVGLTDDPFVADLQRQGRE